VLYFINYIIRASALTFVIGFLLFCSSKDPQGCFPNDKLPSYIEPLTGFGQRAEWSLDGKSVYFVDSAGGDVWMVDVGSKKLKQITKPSYRPEGHGYYRVLCISNGDLLLTCGPERYTLYMQVMDKSLRNPPLNIPNEQINEGPALSRKSMKIAWSPDHKRIFTGEITYNEGIPAIIHKKLIIDNRDVIVDSIKYEDILEPQDLRPPDENELIWSQYGRTSEGVFSSEVMGYDLITGQMVNYSKAPEQYDEPEGIFPDGDFTLVECDKHNPKGTAYIDIYKVRLDESNTTYERLTFFSNVKGFRSSNPVVSDNGRLLAFQASIAGSAAGAGCGLYLFDLEKWAQN
jgi:Tol biopolymer transport system component